MTAGFPPPVPASGLIAAARTPVRLALMTYVGAAGLIGIGIVGSLMFTPGGGAIQTAMQPVRELVQSIVPGVPIARPVAVLQPSTRVRPAALPTVVIDVRVLPSIESTAEPTTP